MLFLPRDSSHRPARAHCGRPASRASAFLAALFLTVAPLAAQESSVLRHVRAKDAGAKLFNLADKSSIQVGNVAAKGLLEVYGESGGYLAVDVPGGMEVWVYGQYLRTTSVAGVVEVTGNGVFMRPLPKSDDTSYPLQPQLHKGDRLKVVGRHDASKPMAEDWIRVVSPAGTRAWVVADDTQAVDAKEDVRAAWSEAVKSANAARVTFDLAQGATVARNANAGGETPGDKRSVAWAGASAPAQKPQVESDASFDAAERAYEAARASASPDWSGVRAAYQRYLEKNPDGPFADRARVQLQKVDLHEEIVRIQHDRTLIESTRVTRLEAAQSALREANRSQDPLWGRFQARGWLVREQPIASAEPRYVVFWAGRPQAEIVCSSGRYDLAKFQDFEIGVSGALLREAVAGSDSAGARPARIDATRLEVIGARAVK